MKFVSVQKYIVTSPIKLREVSRVTKKMTPSEALEKLPFLGKRAAVPLAKVIKSAIFNAKQKNISAQSLEFEEIQINEGPRLKRFRAGSRGRAKPYKKRMSHIRVVLKVIDGMKTEADGEKVKDKPVIKNTKPKSKKPKTSLKSKKSVK